MEFFDQIKELIRPSTEEERKVKETKKIVRSALKSLEQEMKSRGFAGVLIYSDKHTTTLRWGLRVLDSTLTFIGSKFESRGVQVMVSSRAEAKVGFSTLHKSEGGHTWADWEPVEMTPEYRLMQNSSKYLDQELGESTAKQQVSREPTLNNKIRLAIRLAQYIPDGRFDKA